MPMRRPKPVGTAASRAAHGGARPDAILPGGPAVAGVAVGIGADEPTAQSGDVVARLQREREELRRELDQARARIAQLEQLADQDALMPIANRRAFVRELSRMIGFAQRYGMPSSVIYFDVNGMKQINDAYGHAAGDAALGHIADLLCEHTRSSDMVGRLGGDEFGVILAQTSQAQADRKAAGLAATIAATPLKWDGVDIPVSAAYGVYSFSGVDDPHVAIEAADRAMYQHKRSAPAEPDTRTA